MAFDTQTRNRLNNFVADARELLTEEFTNQFQVDYGLDPDTGEISDMDRLTHLDDARKSTALVLRETIQHYYANLPTKNKKPENDYKTLIERVIREQAFTVLNRLCAVRMAEARELVIEAIGQGTQSQGFQLYGHVIGNSLGETGAAYEQYLFSVFDEFAFDLPVLFDRYSPQGRLFPRETVLKELIEHINHPEINHLWAEDETIGWIYQYFNSKEERKAMRDASQAPRNSRELAVRNQFFTPRYVVEFLTDNTLGRIWYEMRKGETSLTDACNYLVRRPNEIFLDEGQEVPEATDEELAADLTQEELLNQPVHIPHRPLKDPREIRMLDPACGSMHFGLYAFDLYHKIYEEFWDLLASDSEVTTEPTELPSLTTVYESRDAFLRDVPRLIIEHNIHGIDIDSRAVQIAGLSLWLRAQRAWKSQGIAAGDRPQVTRSNIVCAEPMPGDQQQLAAFCQELHPAIAQMVTAIFEEMKLAGEAGSLLKIEQEISSLVAKAHEQWRREPKERQLDLFGGAEVFKEEQLEFDLSGITDQQFFEQAEETIYEALRKYASETSEGGFRRKLFAGDAEKGFAFLNIWQNAFDVLLMNPPFGACSGLAKPHMVATYKSVKHELYAAFILRGINILTERGILGAISSRTGWFLKTFQDFREKTVLEKAPPSVFADLGMGVLDDAMVETAAYCLQKGKSASAAFFRLLSEGASEKGRGLSRSVRFSSESQFYIQAPDSFRNIPRSPFAYWTPQSFIKVFATCKTTKDCGFDAMTGAKTNDDPRFLRLVWEVPIERIGVSREDTNERGWARITRGGPFSPFYYDMDSVIDWRSDGHSIKTFVATYRGDKGWGYNWSANLNGHDWYFLPGLTWPLRGSRLSVRPVPAGCLPSGAGKMAFGSEADLPVLLSLANSRAFDSILKLFAGKVGGVQYEAGLIQLIPLPKLNNEQRNELTRIALESWRLKQQIDTACETSHHFSRPELAKVLGDSLDERTTNWRNYVRQSRAELGQRQARLDELAYELYGIPENDQQKINLEFEESEEEVAPDDEEELSDETHSLLERVLSWSFGVAVGRFDIRKCEPPTESDIGPFDALRPCSPGMLQNKHGLPATELPSGYPIELPGLSGILVDDPTSNADVEKSCQAVLLDALPEKVVEEILQNFTSGRSMREWLRKKFFDYHLGCYSKSRREAPIYWPISTESGSYTLWFYYHRLTDQTLYKAVNDFVDPKLKETLRQLTDLRAIKDRTSSQEKELAQLTELESELEQFKADLLEIAAFWKPNLNDGVQITAAPLWKFFRLTKWRNKLKKTWSELESGKYDWAHLALSVWPDRVVREKCTTDRSIAIAHDLEESLWHEVEVTSVSRGGRETTKTEWQPKDLTEAELDAIVAEVKAR